MKNILYPVTLLCLFGFFLPSSAFSTLDTYPPSSNTERANKKEKTLSLQDERFFCELFAVKTDNKNLSFEVYSTDGQKIPGHIYRYHHNGEITYEIGRGLAEGLYIIKMSSKDKNQYYKLIRFGY